MNFISGMRLTNYINETLAVKVPGSWIGTDHLDGILKVKSNGSWMGTSFSDVKFNGIGWVGTSYINESAGELHCRLLERDPQ